MWWIYVHVYLRSATHLLSCRRTTQRIAPPVSFAVLWLNPRCCRCLQRTGRCLSGGTSEGGACARWPVRWSSASQLTTFVALKVFCEAKTCSDLDTRIWLPPRMTGKWRIVCCLTASQIITDPARIPIVSINALVCCRVLDLTLWSSGFVMCQISVVSVSVSLSAETVLPSYISRQKKMDVTVLYSIWWVCGRISLNFFWSISSHHCLLPCEINADKNVSYECNWCNLKKWLMLEMWKNLFIYLFILISNKKILL